MGLVKAGTLTFEAGKPMFDGTRIPLRARVKNTSIFAKIRKVGGQRLLLGRREDAAARARPRRRVPSWDAVIEKLIN